MPNSIQDRTTTDAINRLLLEVSESSQKIKTIKADLKDIAEQNDEYRALVAELKEATEKRAKARKLLEADKDYQTVNSELEELKYRHADLLEILSHHLVTLFTETGETTFITEDGSELQIIIGAKVGQ